MADGKSKTWKLLRVAAILLGVLFLLLIAFPVWFPWILQPVLKIYGAQFGGYDRLSYGRFVVSQVQYTNSNLRLEAARLELLVPTTWLWHHYISGPAAKPYLDGEDWKLSIHQGPPKKPSSNKTNSTFKVIDTVDRIIGHLQNWLPNARLTNGSIVFGETTIELPATDWRAGHLKSRVRPSFWKKEFNVSLQLSSRTQYLVSVEVPSVALESTNRLDRSNDAWTLQGGLRWQTNHANVQARFDSTGWLPSAASVDAEDLILPAATLGLHGYQDVKGSMLARWLEQRFDFQLQAHTEPNKPGALPPVKATTRISGDLHAVSVNQLDVDAPWLKANLSNALVLDYSGALLSGPATFQLRMDRGKEFGADLTGTAQGTLEIRPGPRKYPEATVSLIGTNLAFRDFTVQQLRWESDFSWPLLTVRQLELICPAQSSLIATGALDLAQRSFAKLQWELRGPFLRQFWPQPINLQDIRAHGTLEGPWQSPQHSGRLDVTRFSSSPLKEMDFILDWKGPDTRSVDFALDARAGASSLHIQASAAMSNNWRALSIAVNQLSLHRGAELLYSNIQPAALFLSSLSSTGAHSWQGKITGVDLNGSAGRIALHGFVQWPRTGNVALRVEKLRPETFADFLGQPAYELLVEQVDFQANWADGPVMSQLGVAGKIRWPGAGEYELSGHLVSTTKVTQINRLRVSLGEEEVIAATGSLPLQLDFVSGSNLLQVAWNDPLEFQLTTQTNLHFWNHLSQLSGAKLTDPQLDLRVSGTAREPEGAIAGRIRSIQWQASPSPPLENLALDLTVHEKGITLKQLSFAVAGQPTHATAELPLSDGFWEALIDHKKLPDWHQLTGQISVEDAQISAFASYLPKSITPQGQVYAALSVRPPLQLDGRLRFTNLATHPLPSLGPIRAIHGSVRLDRQRAIIEQVNADVGGQPVSIRGEVQVPRTNLPPFTLYLTGTQVPLVREPGLLIRADLNVNITHTNNADVVIGGEVTLGQSLFLQDIESLIPGGLAQPHQRPPYFSIEQSPFADWKLQLNIKGDRFLKVRSPLFRGVVSTALRLRGDLKEPEAWGEVRIAQGTVQFPFGSLNVEQGLVNLTSANPHDPELLIVAASRVFGYQVKLEITGTASKPIIAFTSTPPLTSEEIVLMLTAGDLPRHDVNFSSQQKAGRLAVFLGKDLFGRLTGNEEIAERLTITSGESVSEQGSPTYQLEYKLSERWSVIGESDRFNELNAGLKWHLYSK